MLIIQKDSNWNMITIKWYFNQNTISILVLSLSLKELKLERKIKLDLKFKTMHLLSCLCLNKFSKSGVLMYVKIKSILILEHLTLRISMI